MKVETEGKTMYHTSHRFAMTDREKAIKLAQELARMISVPYCHRDGDKYLGIPIPEEHVGYSAARGIDGKPNGEFAVWATVYDARDMYTAYGYFQLHGAKSKDI